MNYKLVLLVIVLSISNSFALGERCENKIVSTHAIYHPEDNSTSVYIRSWIKRPLSEIRESFDPQSWDRCSRFFKSTYAVEPGSKTPMQNPPKAGTEWSGDLYEDVAIDVGPFAFSNIKNILWFSGRSMEGESGIVYQWNYGLKESISTTVAGKTYQGGVAIDDGWVRIEQLDEDRWLLDGVKRVGFNLPNWHLNQTLNKTNAQTFQWFLRVVGDELGCCPVSR